MNETGKVLNSIERLRITNPTDPVSNKSEWALINLTLPQPLMSVGSLQVSLKEILIFGGFTEMGELSNKG